MIDEDEIIAGVEEAAYLLSDKDILGIISYAKQHNLSYGEAFEEILQIGATYLLEHGPLPPEILRGEE